MLSPKRNTGSWDLSNQNNGAKRDSATAENPFDTIDKTDRSITPDITLKTPTPMKGQLEIVEDTSLTPKKSGRIAADYMSHHKNARHMR